MSIKLTILKTGETLISEMQELVSDQEFLTEEEKEQNKYGIDVLLTPWIILSKDKKIILPVDCVMTIVEPIEGVKKMFLDKNGTFKIEEETNE